MSLPLVSISCITFNQVTFLRECFDGFLMQKTNFKFEVVVHDDASTDGTKEIIEEYTQNYPDIFFPMYQTENQYSKGVKGIMAKFNFPRAKGKYIAMCEGDDFWTDPYKLQKQVDFLEQNNNYNIVWSKYSKIDKFGNILESDLPNIQSHLYEVNSQNLLQEYRTWTLTAVYRREVINDIDLSKFKYIKDNTIYFLILRNNALGRVLDFNSANYRIHENGIWSSKSDFQNLLANYYNFNEIIDLIYKHESIEMVVDKTIHVLYCHMIDEKFNRDIPFSVYNQLLSNMFHHLTWKEKLRYSRIYFKKLILKG